MGGGGAHPPLQIMCGLRQRVGSRSASMEKEHGLRLPGARGRVLVRRKSFGAARGAARGAEAFYPSSMWSRGVKPVNDRILKATVASG